MAQHMENAKLTIFLKTNGWTIFCEELTFLVPPYFTLKAINSY
jgi:hypothetical protein